MTKAVIQTPVCEILGIDYPILLAGMGGFGACTPPALVAAVSEAGGMGVIGGTALPPEVLRGMIRETRRLTDRPFGVDLLLPVKSASDAPLGRAAIRERIRRDYPRHVAFVDALHAEHGLEMMQVENEKVITAAAAMELVEVVLEERVALFAAALGDPGPIVPRAHAVGMKVLGLAGSVRNAERQRAAGVDLIVATGTEAGGHTGVVGTMPLVPQVVDAVRPLPVLAAGGIGDGRQVAAALALGAEGVWVGTAFLVAVECGVEERFKDLILDARSEDFGISRYYSGKHHRGLLNAVTAAWGKSGMDPLPLPYQKVLMDDFCEAAARKGRAELMQNPSGQVGGMLKARRPAADIMRDLVEGAVAEIERLQQVTGGRKTAHVG